jgi:signal transduction histidine kinase
MTAPVSSRSEREVAEVSSGPDFRAVFEASPSALLLVRADAPRWTILAANEAYRRATHKTSAQLIGQPTFEAFPESGGTVEQGGQRNIRASFERALTAPALDVLPIQRYDLPRPASLGGEYDEHYWRLSTRAIAGVDDGETAVLHHVEEVTAEVRANAERNIALGAAKTAEDRLRTVFAEAPVGIAVTRGPEHVFESANAAYIALVGPRALIGKTRREAFPDIVGQSIDGLLEQVYATGVAVTANARHIRLDWYGDGVFRDAYYSFVYQPLRDAAGQTEGVAIIASDVTELVGARKAAEERHREVADLNTALREQHDELEQLNEQLQSQGLELEQQLEESQNLTEELAQVNEQLEGTAADLEAAGVRLQGLYEAERAARAEAEQSRADAQAANKAKSDFLATMSHELRTPLNAIAGYTELLETGIRGPVTAEQIEDLQRIRRAGTHLLGLINDVLNYAKLEASQVRFDVVPLPVNETLLAAAAMIEPQALVRGVTFTCVVCDPDCRIMGDRDKVLQVVLNLLTNAIKFTPRGGRITLAADVSDPWGRITVCDTGRGVPSDQVTAIFEPFVQVGARLSGREEGTGLGLAISRELARGMRGDLTVESVVGEGSTFTLSLPCG